MQLWSHWLPTTQLFLLLCRENSARDQQYQDSRHDQALAQQQQAHMDALTVARSQADSALEALREAKEADARVFQQRASGLESELAEESAGRREAEFELRRVQGELDKASAEAEFHRAAHSETAALLRTRDQELAGIERDLARMTAKKEALEGQIVDKEEVDDCLCVCLCLCHL